MPVLSLGDASAYLLRDVPKGGRAHYARASELLSRATGQEIAVSLRPSGRPRLAAPYPELGVSLSYREGSLLVGYSPTGAVGVDLEADDAGLEASQLARDHFAPDEARAVAERESEADRRDLFLRLWVAKEAALKTTGRGVYDGLDQPDLSSMIAALRDDEGSVAFAASPRVPAGLVVVRKLMSENAPTLYLALARLSV